MRSLAVLVLLAACGPWFPAKRDDAHLDVRPSPPESEPDTDDAAARVLAGDDVVISRSGDWLVGLRCLWVLRERHQCDVAFVERGRLVGTVPVAGSHVRRAVAAAIETHLGADRVSLSHNFVYGSRDPRAPSVLAMIEAKELVLRDFTSPHVLPPRAHTPWPYGTATSRPVTFQSPRARDHIVVPIELAPDRASAFALFRVDAPERYTFVMFIPPIDRPPDLPRFPSEADVRSLHAAVMTDLAALEARGPRDETTGLAMKLRWLRLEDWLATPTARLDLLETLQRLRAEIHVVR